MSKLSPRSLDPPTGPMVCNYFLAKLCATDGKSFQCVAAQMAGMSQEDYARMMSKGGRTPED